MVDCHRFFHKAEQIDIGRDAELNEEEPQKEAIRESYYNIARASQKSSARSQRRVPPDVDDLTRVPVKSSGTAALIGLIAGNTAKPQVPTMGGGRGPKSGAQKSIPEVDVPFVSSGNLRQLRDILRLTFNLSRVSSNTTTHFVSRHIRNAAE
jgi:hypothetical protein